MKCHDVREWLRRDLDGAAEPSSEAAAHLERCGACAREAERLQAIAAAARGALPPADAPEDFAERVLAAVGPLGDRALVHAARPRLSRWWPVLLVAVVLPVLATWPRERAGDALPLEAFAASSAGGLELTALARSLLDETEPVTMRAGALLVEAEAPAVLHTDLADVRLHAGAVCVLRLLPEKETEKMNFAAMKRFVPAVLAVTVLSGGATVVNAQGREEIEEQEAVRVRRGEAPIREQIDQARREIDRVRALMESLEEVTRRLQVKVERIQRTALDVEAQRQLTMDQIKKVAEAVEKEGWWRQDADAAERALEAMAPDPVEWLLKRAAQGDEKARKRLVALQDKIHEALHRERAVVIPAELPPREMERRLLLRFQEDQRKLRVARSRARREEAERLGRQIAHNEEIIERLERVEHLEAAIDEMEHRDGLQAAVAELELALDRTRKELAKLMQKEK